jgi:hypothetical protein
MRSQIVTIVFMGILSMGCSESTGASSMPTDTEIPGSTDSSINSADTQPDVDTGTRTLEDRGVDTDGEGQTEVPSDQRDNSELWEFTGGNPAERNVYKCEACTFEQVLAVARPTDNWDKNVSEGNRRLFFPEATNIAPEVPLGTALSLGLVPEIEGDDHFLIAKVLSGTVLGRGDQGVLGLGRVAGGTTMIYRAGKVLHKVASPDGVEYVLWSMAEAGTALFDPFVVNGLAEMSLPPGWTYSSEVASEDLIVGTPDGVASVFLGQWLVELSRNHNCT